jgi:hypothetical protein
MPIDENFKILKVTMEVKYYVPMPDKEIMDEKTGEPITSVNGWPMSEVKKDWFERHDINRFHATRNAFEIGGGKKIIKIEEVEDV